MSDLPTEPGVYVSQSVNLPDILHAELAKLKEQNVSIYDDAWMRDLLILRDFLRDKNNDLIDPANEYCYIGDGHVDVKVARNMQWWNEYWCAKSDEPIFLPEWILPTGRYRVYKMDEQWLYCQWESEL